MKGKKLDQGTVDEAAAMLREDDKLSIRQVADHFHVNESTLRGRLKPEAGVPSVGEPSLLYDGDLHDKEIPVIHRHYEDHEEHYVYPMSDIHKGSARHNQERWEEWLGYIEATPNTSLILNGDLLNSAILGSKSDVYTEVSPLQTSKYMLVDELEPVADQIDSINPGNHEDRVWRATGSDPVFDLSNLLGIQDRYFNPVALLVYHVGDVEYTMFVRHGTGGGGKRVGSKANNLEDMARVIVADIYTMGHSHTQLVFPQEVFVYEGGRVVRRRQYFAASGSFLDYEEYAAAKGMPPTKIGAPRIRLAGDRKDTHVSI